jgi:ribosomal protein S18 acetylase RimI-like enzyme
MQFADLSLAQRLEAAEAQKYADYTATRGRQRPTLGCVVESAAGGYGAFAGHGNPYSRGIGMGLHGPVSAAELDRFEAFYRERDCAPALSLCPLAAPSLIELLSERGYRLERFMQTWYRELTTDDRRATTADIVVRPILPEEAELWVLTANRGFAGDAASVPPDSIVAAYPHMQHAACWLAWLPGAPPDEPAGAGSLAIHAGVAELFGASVRPSCRGRGVQTALMQARMAAAVTAGCDLIAVHTDPGSASQRNVERAGFRLAYTKAVVQRS